MSRRKRASTKGASAPTAQRSCGILSQPSRPLYPRGKGNNNRSWTETLMKAAIRDAGARSQQGAILGRKAHPFDMVNAALFSKSNPHHAAAIDAKKNATIGLGFATELDKAIRLNEQRAKLGQEVQDIDDAILVSQRSRAADILDPLCAISLQDLMNSLGEDLSTTNNCYMEVVRKGSDPINGTPTGLHHIPAGEVFLVVENDAHDFHFEHLGASSKGPSTRRFARYGDKANFIERAGKGIAGMPSLTGAIEDPEQVSEVIHIRFPSAMNRYYGIPTWLSAVAAIELVQALHQAEFDFYNNRGVPEFLLFLLGKQLDPEEWASVEKIFQGSIGLGNTRKSGAFNFTGEVEVQLEKLALEGKSDGRFSEMLSALALEIITGHRIPPLLAGVQTPGKLGANNELPNALLAYQTLVVSPDQNTIQATLGCTLGNKELNGGLGLTFEDFELRTIMDVFDFGKMDTISRMRQTQVEAAGEGRNVEDGLKKSAIKLLLGGETDPEVLLGKVLGGAVERILEESAG